ncbi:MAG: hypothetical protein ACREDR_01610 [Blastocatellia bacterium]
MTRSSSGKPGNSDIADAQPEIEAIRVESVLSRYPMHALAKHGGKEEINIVETDEGGKVVERWQVVPNRTFGEPGPLAYKLDTLVINRAIDEAARPLPKLLGLGTLRDICRQLGCAEDTRPVRRALRQNASAWIIVKLNYKDINGKERVFEAEFSRYSIIFNGEELPGSGEKAKEVHVILSDPYHAFLNSAPRRPLDYEYLKALSPAAQRFYEVFSFNVFAALKAAAQRKGSAEPVAQMRYSRYCTLSGQKRSYKADNVRPQMADVFRPHLKSGYLESAKLTPTVDDDGNPDWIITARPGQRAKAEFGSFNQKHAGRISSTSGPEGAARFLSAAENAGQSVVGLAPSQLVQYFHQIAHGVDGYAPVRGGKELKLAEEILTEYGAEAARYIVDYSVRESTRTDFLMATFGAVRQYVARAVVLYGTLGSGQESRRPTGATDPTLEAELEQLRAYEEASNRAEAMIDELASEERDALRDEARSEIAEYARSRKLSIDDSSLAGIILTRMKQKLTARLLGADSGGLFSFGRY